MEKQLTNDEMKSAIDRWRFEKDGKESEPEKEGALDIAKAVDNWKFFNKNQSSNHGK